MSKLEKLSQAYTDYLNSLNVQPDEGHALIQNTFGLNRIITVNDRILTIPNKTTIATHNSKVAIFHPLCENVLLGESPVLQELRYLTMESLQEIIVNTISSILKISQDPQAVKSLSPSQVEWLKCTNGADATTIKNFQSLARRFEVRGSKYRVISLFFQRGQELNGETYKRVAVVNFNLYEELDKSNIVYGVKLRKSDVSVLKTILETIFDKIDEADEYSVGSNSVLSPYFDVLLKAHYGLLKQLNGVTWKFRKAIKELTGLDLHVSDEYFDTLINFEAHRDVIPSMPLSDGDRKEERERVAEQAPPVTQAPTPAPQIQQAPVQPIPQSTPQQHYQQSQPVYQQPMSQPMQQPQPYQQPVQQQARFPTLQEQLSGVGRNPYQQGYMQQPYPQQQPMGWNQQPQPQGYYPQPVQPQQYPQAVPPQYPQPGMQPMQGYVPQAFGYSGGLDQFR